MRMCILLLLLLPSCLSVFYCLYYYLFLLLNNVPLFLTDNLQSILLSYQCQLCSMLARLVLNYLLSLPLGLFCIYIPLLFHLYLLCHRFGPFNPASCSSVKSSYVNGSPLSPFWSCCSCLSLYSLHSLNSLFSSISFISLISFVTALGLSVLPIALL